MLIILKLIVCVKQLELRLLKKTREIKRGMKKKTRASLQECSYYGGVREKYLNEGKNVKEKVNRRAYVWTQALCYLLVKQMYFICLEAGGCLHKSLFSLMKLQSSQSSSCQFGLLEINLKQILCSHKCWGISVKGIPFRQKNVSFIVVSFAAHYCG